MFIKDSGITDEKGGNIPGMKEQRNYGVLKKKNLWSVNEW